MNKSKIIKIAVIFVIFLLLVAVYSALKKYNANENKKAEAGVESTEVLSISADEIESLKFTVSGEEVEFVQEDEQWSLKSDENFPVDGEQMKVITDALYRLTTDRILEGVENPDDFGFAKPKNKIIITKKKGNPDAITIGDTNSVTGNCYISLNGDTKKIFTVDSDFVTVFSGSLMNYAALSPYPTIVGSNITNMLIQKSGQVSQLRKTNSEIGNWTITDETGMEQDADSGTVATLQSAIAGISYANSYEYYCADMAQYGLDEAYAVITVNYSTAQADQAGEGSEGTAEEAVQEELKIFVGNEDGNGNRYIRINDSKEVHAVAEEALASVLKEQGVNYEDTAVTTVSVNDLESMDIVIDTKKYTVLVESAPLENKDNQENKYLLDGEEMNAETFLSFYTKATSLGNQGKLKEHKEIVGNPGITLIYHLKNGTVKEISYIPYDTNFYAAVSTGDEAQFLVNKMKVKELIDETQNLFSSDLTQTSNEVE